MSLRVRFFSAGLGFTLLEVMIAVSIIAIAFVTLFGSQAKSLSHATETKFNNVAPLLASAKLADLESQNILITDDEGDFGDEFAGFIWQLETEDADMSNIKALAELEKPLQRIRLVVAHSELTYKYTLTCIIRREE